MKTTQSILLATLALSGNVVAQNLVLDGTFSKVDHDELLRVETELDKQGAYFAAQSAVFSQWNDSGVKVGTVGSFVEKNFIPSLLFAEGNSIAQAVTLKEEGQYTLSFDTFAAVAESRSSLDFVTTLVDTRGNKVFEFGGTEKIDGQITNSSTTISVGDRFEKGIKPGEYQLRFEGTQGVALDNVKLGPASSVPEPSSLLALIGGSLLLGTRRRR